MAADQRPGTRRPTRALGALGVAALVAIASLAGCSSDPKTPAEQREARVRERIEASFSRSQTTCIMKVLDPATIKALDRDATLKADSEALRIYSNAVVACAGG